MPPGPTPPAQLDLFASPRPVPVEIPRWSLTRPFRDSRLRERALLRLDAVRVHFPELDRTTIRVGRTRSRRAQAWASLDPAAPALWVKPGALPRFTIAHELTHLLQALGLVPAGEKSADLHALARHPDVVDERPSYLAVPASLFSSAGEPGPGVALALHRAAVDAIREAGGRPRRAIRLFEGAALKLR